MKSIKVDKQRKEYGGYSTELKKQKFNLRRNHKPLISPQIINVINNMWGNKLRIWGRVFASRTYSDKIVGREGNSPDHKLRSQKEEK